VTTISIRFASEGKINAGMNQARVRAFKRLLRQEKAEACACEQLSLKD
jgi:hypothetical protein